MADATDFGKHLSENELLMLFQTANWDDLDDQELLKKYSDYSILGLLKACVLPFLINIPSERSLGRILTDNISLQQLCGFSPQNLPSRATLWHFRRKYSINYRWWVLQILALLTIQAKNLGIPLPFITSPPGDGSFEKRTFYFKEAEVMIWAQDNLARGGERNDPQQQLLPFPDWDYTSELQATAEHSEKRRLAEDVGLPAELLVNINNTEALHVGLVEPWWHYHDVLDFDRSISMTRPTDSPYIACNILVLREVNGDQQVLLARRLGGDFGKDEYATPGGKKALGETVLDCAKRELREETNLDFESGTPISYRETHFPGKPPATSIGILVHASNSSGAIIRRERNTHDEWRWYSLQNLPNALFKPAKYIIEDFLCDKREDLSWERIESKIAEKEKAYLRQGRQRALWE